MNVRERVVGQGLGHAPLDQIGRRVHPGGAQVVDDRSRLPIGRVRLSWAWIALAYGSPRGLWSPARG